MSSTDPTQPMEPAEPGAEATTVWSPPSDELSTSAAAATAEPSPVSPTPTPGPRVSRVRWVLALIMSVVVVGLAAGATLLVTGQTPASGLVGYVDNSSVIYAEARLDLPGDQRQKLGEFLSKFPGFDDQSILDRKLDEALDRLIIDNTHGSQDWSTKIKPWFDGQIVVGVGIPDTVSADEPGRFHGVVALGVRDGQAALNWFKAAVADRTITSQQYNGTDMLVISGAKDTGAVAVADGKALLAGDVESVKKAIDSHGHATFADSDGYKQARAAFTSDSLGFAVVDAQHYMDVVLRMSAPAGFPLPTIAPVLKAFVPPWLAVNIRAEGDALALDFASPHLTANDAGDNRPSDIIGHLPASTIVAAEGHDLAASWKKLLDAYRQVPELQNSIHQLDSALGLLGGFDAVVGWIRDGALVVTRDGPSIYGGLVLAPTDKTQAEHLLTALRSFVVLGGGQAGITIADEKYNGTTISTVDFGDLRELMNLAGAGGPLGPSLPVQGHVKLAYAATDNLVVFGADETFVKSILDTKADASLGSDARFKAAADRADGSNRGFTYVDLSAARELIENLIPDSSERAEYEREYKPYLSALKAFLLTNREDGAVDRGTEWLIVGK
jgi:hypothetical protein